MTTIACDGKSMAADSLTTGGGERVAFTTKIHRLPDGRIYGCAGYSSDGIKFGRWLVEEGERPAVDDGFEALILMPDGGVHWIGKALEPQEYFAPMTIGSGAGMALGAMLAGKSPSEAVRIAMLRDIHSGGDVAELHLDTPLRAVA